MSRRHNLRRWLNVNTLEQRLAPAIILWQGNGVGDPNAWSNGNNWAGGNVPLTTDTAKFDTNNVQVNVDVAETVAGIQLTTNWGSTFNLATSLSTTGASTWSNSSISGGGTWNNSGTVNIDTNQVTLSGVTVTNTGTINLLTASNINCGSSAVINNNAMGIIDIHTDGGIAYGFGNEQIINNAGIIRKTGGTTNSVVQGIINNQGGTWDSQSSGGTLHMHSDGGTHTGGIFKASTGAFLDVTDGQTATWKGTYTGSGAGVVFQSSGTIAVDAAGVTFNFPTGLYEWDGGQITGTGTLTNKASTGFITLNGGTATLNGVTFSNAGTITHKTSNNLNAGSATSFTNETTGVYNFQSDGDFVFGFGNEPTFNNKGLVKKTAGAADSVVQAIINNQGGTWDSQFATGTLHMQSDGGTHTGGTFNASTGAFLDITNGATATWKGTYTGSGGGTVFQANGIITVDASGATFNFPAGLYEWDGGAITGGTLSNTGTIKLNGNTPVLSAGTISNSGTINHATANNLQLNSSAQFQNTATGTYVFQSDGSMVNAAGNIPTVTNSGLIRKTGGTGTSGVDGAVSVPGGVWEAISGTLGLRSLNQTHTGGTFKATTPGVVNMTDASAATWTGSYTASGTGTVGIFDSTTIDAAGATFNFPATTPLHWSNSSISGGTLTNTGFILIDNLTVAFSGNAFVNFINQNTVTQTTGNNLQLNSAAQFQNTATGVYLFQGDGSIVNAAGNIPTLTNSGLIRKTAGTGVSGVDGAVSVPGGVWESLTGTLGLRSFGQTHTGGLFKATSPGVVNMTDLVAANWKGSYTASGTGTVGIFDTTTIDAAGATFNFPAATPLHWSNSSINGGTLTNSGFILIDGGTVALSNDTLINKGTITHTTTNNFQLNSSAQFQNTASGIYDFQSDGSLSNAAGNIPTLTNNGLIKKTGGTGTSTADGAVSVPGGIWQSLTGTLALRSFNQTHTGGIFEATSPGIVSMTGGVAANWQGSYTASGNGTVGIFDSTTIDPAGATFNFPSTTPLHWSAGIISGGTLTNTGFIVIDSGTVAFSGNAFVNFINQNTVTHTTANNLQLNSAAQFQNTVLGVYDFQGDGSIINAAGNTPTLTNSGLIKKTGGTSTSFVDGAVSVSGGVWQALAGQLALRSFGQTHTGGTFEATAPGVVNLTGGVAANWKGGAFISSGTGTVGIFDSTTMDAAGATFNFPASTPLHWSNGIISGGTMTNAGFMLIDSNTVAVSNTTLVNTGTITHTTANNLQLNSSAQFQNGATGLYDFQSDASIFYAAGNAPTVTNSGLIRKSVGSGTSSVVTGGGNYVNSGGLIDIQTGSLSLPSTFTANKGGLLGKGTLLNSVNNNDGFVRPGPVNGVLTINGTYSQGPNALFVPEMKGTTAADFTQMQVSGLVTLGGILQPIVNYAAKVNDTFDVIQNNSGSSIVGAFSNAPNEGSTVTVNGTTFSISYKGGVSTHDVVLKVTSVVPGPTTPPKVVAVTPNGGGVQRSRVTTLLIQFDQAVTEVGTTAAAFQLKRQSDNASVTLGGFDPSFFNAKFSQFNIAPVSLDFATLTFIGGPTDFGSLADGRYTLTIQANQITSAFGQLDGNGDGTGGDNYVQVGAPGSGSNLFRFYGDINGDGTVSASDFIQFRQFFGGSNFAFDFDGDGAVAASDFIQFRLRFGGSI